jgi:methylmalonyl-CoA/ethylmalonyl-CoA epimerase
MIQQIDHIGIAVQSLEVAARLYEEVLGLTCEGHDHVEEQGVKVAFYRCGEVMIELLEPTRPDSPVGKFLATRGEGIHHIALKTDDLVAEREHAKTSGLRLLSDKPLDGAHGKLISFIHPKDTLGVLLELTQRKQAPHHEG